MYWNSRVRMSVARTRAPRGATVRAHRCRSPWASCVAQRIGRGVATLAHGDVERSGSVDVPCVAKGAGRKEGPDGSDRAPVGRGVERGIARSVLRVRICPGLDERAMASMSSISAAVRSSTVSSDMTLSVLSARAGLGLGGGGGAPSRPGFVWPASEAKCFPHPQLARSVVAVARLLRGFEPDHRVRPELPPPRPGAPRA